MNPSQEIYLSPEYLQHNPTWDQEQTPWKAAKIAHLLRRLHLNPRTVCEVGCGSGGILAHLRDYLGASCRLVGYDIAPALQEFWDQHRGKNIAFFRADFCETQRTDSYDLLLLMDVLEHLENPFDFLRLISHRGRHIILHIPLELHAQGAWRNTPIIKQRQNVGHLHFWNKDLALMNLEACGLEVMHWEYTAVAVEQPTQLWTRKLARLPRRLLFAVAPDLAVRSLGGFSLLVLARVTPALKPS
jgi:2-polyprenyl-3-methyl-5-hydroxy-6-metoxy-1,4-benzoquinol methylase